MNQPKITAIIPTFRRPDLLQRAVASVQAQHYRNIEICIYDNNSGDSTAKVVEGMMRMDGRIAYFKRDSNIGAINNMIDACLRVRTPLYSIVNDDDFILPGLYQNAVDAFGQFPDAGMACATTVAIYVEQWKWKLMNQGWQPGYYGPTPENAARMFRSHFVQTGVVIRTEVRDVLGPFEPSGDDRLYMTIAAAAIPFVVLDCVGAVFTLHSGSYTANVNLRGGDEEEVFKAMGLTAERILQLPSPDASKGFLLLLAMAAYSESFRNRLWGSEFGSRKIAEGSAEALLPSVGWKKSALLSFVGGVPQMFRGCVKKCVGKLAETLPRIAYYKRLQDWSDLPEIGEVHTAIVDLISNGSLSKPKS